ncbi:MAG: YeeE/YedE thiosulfate transporter family protein [Deinococcus sp.]|uniref:DUF6691 family protein n=1 Tax=Deinococcus sp. TaxID=47478 RepID=UPI0026DC6FCA|nr:DUF6691 family protein [Deinococcus sp.]MDO4245560.1 YeeE/YedE thiosulfate transporter family protein [Deinococcus sp.]
MKAAPTPARIRTGLLAYLVAGLWFGLLLVKSEAASWYRIQEMFRFQSFHMFGIIGSAIVTALVTTALLRRFGKTREGENVRITPKEKGSVRYVVGGLLFGLGWGLVGLCPGPIFVQLGAGLWTAAVALVFALIGTYLYGLLRERLPH